LNSSSISGAFITSGGDSNGLRADAMPRIERALAGFVGHELDAAAAFDDERPGLPQAREIDVRMHQRLDVADGKIAQRRHESPFAIPSSGRVGR
jgi:hypothetical protein